jgi:hypothetical protein
MTWKISINTSGKIERRRERGRDAMNYLLYAKKKYCEKYATLPPLFSSPPVNRSEIGRKILNAVLRKMCQHQRHRKMKVTF